MPTPEWKSKKFSGAKASRFSPAQNLLDASAKGKLKTVSFEQNGKAVSVSAEEILFALGRVPNTASLDLEKAGVKTEQWPHRRERNHADERAAHFRGGRLHRAARDRPHRRSSRAKRRRTTLLKPKSPRRMDYRLLISVVFTEPQVAFVGLTEKEATARENSISRGELSVQRPRQIAHHGGEGRFCETAGESEVRRNPRRRVRRAGRRRTDPRNRRGDGQAHDRSRTGGDAALSSDAGGNLDLSGGGTGGANFLIRLLFVFALEYHRPLNDHGNYYHGNCPDPHYRRRNTGKITKPEKKDSISPGAVTSSSVHLRRMGNGAEKEMTGHGILAALMRLPSHLAQAPPGPPAKLKKRPTAQMLKSKSTDRERADRHGRRRKTSRWRKRRRLTGATAH